MIKTSPANPPKAASARNPGAVRDRGLGGIGPTPAAPRPGCAPPLPPDPASPPLPGGRLRAPGTRCVCPHWPGILLCTLSVSSANCRLLPFLCPLWHLKPQARSKKRKGLTNHTGRGRKGGTDDRHCVSSPTTAPNPRFAPVMELCPLDQARGGLYPARSARRPTSLGLTQATLPGVTVPDTQDPGPPSAAGSPGSSAALGPTWAETWKPFQSSTQVFAGIIPIIFSTRDVTQGGQHPGHTHRGVKCVCEGLHLPGLKLSLSRGPEGRWRFTGRRVRGEALLHPDSDPRAAYHPPHTPPPPPSDRTRP